MPWTPHAAALRQGDLVPDAVARVSAWRAHDGSYSVDQRGYFLRVLAGKPGKPRTVMTAIASGQHGDFLFMESQ